MSGTSCGFHLDVEQIMGGEVDQGALAAKSMAAGLFNEGLDVRREVTFLNGRLEGLGDFIGSLGQAAGAQADPDHRPVRGGEQVGSQAFQLSNTVELSHKFLLNPTRRQIFPGAFLSRGWWPGLNNRCQP